MKKPETFLHERGICPEQFRGPEDYQRVVAAFTAYRQSVSKTYYFAAKSGATSTAKLNKIKSIVNTKP